MQRATRIDVQFVDYVPEQMQPATLYISIPFRTTSHLCPCGCGEKIVNTLRPDKWAVTFDGSAVTIRPSIGNSGIPCMSHYWIIQNRVEWLPALTPGQAVFAMGRDGWQGRLPTERVEKQARRAWWRRWFRSSRN